MKIRRTRIDSLKPKVVGAIWHHLLPIAPGAYTPDSKTMAPLLRGHCQFMGDIGRYAKWPGFRM